MDGSVKFRAVLLFTTVVTGQLVAFTPAFAQPQVPQTSGSNDSSAPADAKVAGETASETVKNDDNRFGGEIIVTAQKRAENVQRVPASITALSEKSLAMAGVIDPTRLGLIVPGLRVGFSGTEARFAIRGARTNNVGPQAQQVVGIFNDGAYVATVGQVMAAYLDVARIEVLRGPQGTLYGRNTFAGAVNIISNQPDLNDLSGRAQITFGNYSRVRGEAVLNLPITPTFAVRISGMGEQHNGYIINTHVDGPSDDLRNENVQVGRITARWKPSSDFEATLRYTKYHRDVNVDALYGYIQIGCYRNNLDPTTATGNSANATYVQGNCWRPGPDSAASTGPTGAATLTDVGPYNVSRDGPSRALAKGDSVNLQMAYDLGPATLSFVGAYDKYSSVNYYDPDTSNGYHYGQFGQDSLNNFFAGYDNSQNSYSGELRLASPGTSRLQWLVGAYYFKQASDNQFGYLANGKYTRYDTVGHDTFNAVSKAVFGNAKFEVFNGFRVLGGIRYNEDKQKLVGGAFGGGGKKTLWKAGAEYDASQDVLLYGTVSTGYRVGGVNGSQLVAAGAPAVFGPENVTAYEAGFKSRFLDHTLTLNGAIFYNSYRNMQAQSFLNACIDPNNPASCIASEFTSNGGKINAKGAELEFNWLPGKSFFLNGSLAYLDAKFGDYQVSQVPGLGNVGGRQDVTRTPAQIVAAGGNPQLQLSGWRPALQPKYTAAVQTGYVYDFGTGNSITPMAQVSYSAQYWSFDYNLPGSEQRSFAKVDLRLTWRNKPRHLSVEGFVENLTNQAVLVRSVIFSPVEANVPTASIQANYGDPRTFGLRVGYDF